MNKIFDALFFIVFSIYNRWRDFDAFYHSAFIVGVLFASTVNFLIKLLFVTTKNEFFDLELPMLYVIWISIIGCITYYYYRRKGILTEFYSKNRDQLNRNYIPYYIILVLMFLTWFSPIMFRIIS